MSEMIEVKSTNNCHVSDTIIPFSLLTDREDNFILLYPDNINLHSGNVNHDDSEVSKYMSELLQRKGLLLYFNSYYLNLFNDQLKFKCIGELAKNINMDIAFISNLEIAELCGIDYSKEYGIIKPTLLVIDRNRVVRNIYINVTDDDIIDILSGDNYLSKMIEVQSIGYTGTFYKSNMEGDSEYNTTSLNISDTLPIFGVEYINRNGETLKIPNFTKDYLILFLNDYFYSMYNDDIKYKNIGDLAKEKNIDIMFLSNFRFMELFGIECNPISYINRFETTYSYIIVADKNNIVKKIYKDACDNDIICIMKELAYNF
jgi:hypothetical protein